MAMKLGLRVVHIHHQAHKNKVNLHKIKTRQKSMGKEKCIHDGHRERLLQLAYNAGIENMSDVQIVEFFLTFIFPRGDVNPLAHRLLDEFGDFQHILEASVEELMEIFGINERSAKKIYVFKDFLFYYTTCRMKRKTPISCKAELIDIVEDYLRFRTRECILLLGLSEANIVTHTKLLTKDSTFEVGISAQQFSAFLTSSRAAGIVVAHCHPFGMANSSSADADAFKFIENICFNLGVRLIDGYIIGEDGVYSQKEEKLVRTYHDIDQLKDVFSIKK